MSQQQLHQANFNQHQSKAGVNEQVLANNLKADLMLSQVKFIYLTIRKNTQEGHSEKTTRSSRSTAPLWQYFYTYCGKLNLKK